ncbi:MAG: HAD family hydrolase [Woeseiaceae bacterium]
MNIVFDLGGVVFEWRPAAIIRSVFDDSETQNSVRVNIFEHPDWIALDRGTIALDHAIDRGATRTGLPRQDIERLMNEVPRSLAPIEGTIELIRTIHNTKNELFVLSNMSLASISHLERNHGIWDLFDGVVISCRIQKVKPEIAIYEHLLATHGLEPAETVFIDDMNENLEAASSLGIQTIRFIDPSQCREALTALGCM